VPRTRQTTGNHRQGRHLLMDNDVHNDKYYSTPDDEPCHAKPTNFDMDTEEMTDEYKTVEEYELIREKREQ